MSRTPMKEIKDMTVCVVGLPPRRGIRTAPEGDRLPKEPGGRRRTQYDDAANHSPHYVYRGYERIRSFGMDVQNVLI